MNIQNTFEECSVFWVKRQILACTVPNSLAIYLYNWIKRYISKFVVVCQSSKIKNGILTYIAEFIHSLLMNNDQLHHSIRSDIIHPDPPQHQFEQSWKLVSFMVLALRPLEMQPQLQSTNHKVVIGRISYERQLKTSYLIWYLCGMEVMSLHLP